MLEEKFANELINLGALVSILDETQSKAVADGEDELTGKKAQELLNKLSDAVRRGDVTEYDLVFMCADYDVRNCDYDVLHITEKGIGVDYKKSEQKETIMLCEKGDGKGISACKYLKVCPSYLAYNAGKELLFQEE